MRPFRLPYPDAIPVVMTERQRDQLEADNLAWARLQSTIPTAPVRYESNPGGPSPFRELYLQRWTLSHGDPSKFSAGQATLPCSHWARRVDADERTTCLDCGALLVRRASPTFGIDRD